MQKIEGTTIKVNRGDILNILLELETDAGTAYTFQVGDIITFNVYNKGELNEAPIITKTKEIEASGTNTIISLTNDDTRIGELLNKPMDYWYEIKLNDEYTVVGYDDDGAKIFRLYPEGRKLS